MAPAKSFSSLASVSLVSITFNDAESLLRLVELISWFNVVTMSPIAWLDCRQCWMHNLRVASLKPLSETVDWIVSAS